MVGIFGILSDSNFADIPILPQSNLADSSTPPAYYNYQEQDPNFYLNLTQFLAQAETSANHAFPYFESEDKKYVCALVGGIFNRKELRDRLISRGYVFETMLDSELIVYLYKLYGVHNLEKLEGSFSLFFLDRTANKLIIARDGVGSKPLYYSSTNNYFAFSSDLSSFLNYPSIKQNLGINWKQVVNFLRYGKFAVNVDFYQGINTFPAGHYAMIDLNSKQFYIQAFNAPNLKELKSAEHTEEFIRNQIEILTDGLLKQQLNDLHTGLILDGSAGSVSLAAIIQQNSSKKLQTYSFKKLDPKLYQYKNISGTNFAHLLNTKHTEIDINQFDPRHLLQEYSKYAAIPVGDVSGIIHLAIAKCLQQDTQLLWNSLGVEYAYQCSKIQLHAKHILALSARLPKFLHPFLCNYYKLAIDPRLLSSESFTQNDLILNLFEIFTNQEINQLLHPNLAKLDLFGELDLKECNQVQFFAEKYLSKRQSEVIEPAYLQFGMENRNAYLINKLVNNLIYASSDVMKSSPKTILERLADSLLKKDTVYNDYEKFSQSVLVKWLKLDLKNIVNQLVHEKALEATGFWNSSEVLRIKNTFYQKPNIKHANQLWVILQLQMWYKNWHLS